MDSIGAVESTEQGPRLTHEVLYVRVDGECHESAVLMTSGRNACMTEVT